MFIKIPLYIQFILRLFFFYLILYAVHKNELKFVDRKACNVYFFYFENVHAKHAPTKRGEKNIVRMGKKYIKFCRIINNFWND